jgi:hypothetical protein
LRGAANPGLSVIDVTTLSRYWGRMKPISFARHRFPPGAIRQAVRLYLFNQQ